MLTPAAQKFFAEIRRETIQECIDAIKLCHEAALKIEAEVQPGQERDFTRGYIGMLECKKDEDQSDAVKKEKP